MTLVQAQAWLVAHEYALTEDAGGGYEVWHGRERVARVFDATRLLWWVLSNIYRTGPPPNGATPAHLAAWAVQEAAAWPGTPQGVYTYWLKRAGPATKTMPRTKASALALSQAMMELI